MSNTWIAWHAWLVSRLPDLPALRGLRVRTRFLNWKPQPTFFAWLMDFTDNQAVFTIGWWIASYRDKYYVRNRVNLVIVRVLNQAGVVLLNRKGRMHGI